MAMEKMKEMHKGEMVVLVDTQASKENVSRAVQSQGWEVKDIREDGEEFHLSICRK
jgi:TusA-related sulfurtransferase